MFNILNENSPRILNYDSIIAIVLYGDSINSELINQSLEICHEKFKSHQNITYFYDIKNTSLWENLSQVGYKKRKFEIDNKTEFNFDDFDIIMNKMMVGWQPNEHQFTSNIIDHIAIHEMGHAVVGFFSKHHSKMSKVVINLSSPKSPGYTVFESSTSNIYVREALFEHLMILLSGRIAEEVFYNVSVTTGALNDFEEALKLAEKMVLYYGMGSNVIYPSNSEKYKELIDNDVIELINNAYNCAQMIIMTAKDLIYETSEILKKDKLLKADALESLINEKYKDLITLIK
jgi:ATP-dependent Zn protease